MVAVKVCGLKRQEHVAVAVEAGADWIGLVHFPKSPRHVSLSQAVDLTRFARELSSDVRITALLVDPDEALLDDVICEWEPDALQLHGKESPDRVTAIKREFERGEVWRALPVSSADDVAVSGVFSAADRFLFDAKPPKDASRPGGLGEPFDWTLMRQVPVSKPWLLAGGLTIENVGDAIVQSGARAVDVSTGLEIEPGVKDSQKIIDFVSAAKSAKE